LRLRIVALALRVRLHSLRSFGSRAVNHLQRFPENGQFEKTQENVDDPEPGNGATHEVIQNEIPKWERIGKQYVCFPQCGPRHKDKEEPNLETEKNEGNGEETVHFHKEARSQKPKARMSTAFILASGF
jgi:hypothetical protein